MESSGVTQRLLSEPQASGVTRRPLSLSQVRSGTTVTDPPTSSYTPVTEGSGVRPTGYHAPRVEFTGECPRYSPANSTFGTRATIDRPKIPYRPSSGTTKVTWPSSGTTSVTPARHPLHPRLASAARVRTIADRHSWRRSLRSEERRVGKERS